LLDYLNENTNFTLLFENGYGFRDGLYWEDNRLKLAFTKSATPIDWRGIDIQRESKTRGRRNTIADAIERYFRRTPIGICDDRANEAADFVIVDKQRFILIHSKFSSEPRKGLRAEDLQVVCSQALKNMRFFVPDAVEARLESWYGRVFTRNRLTLERFKDKIRAQLNNPSVQKECWIVQPGISKARLDAHPRNKMHILLNHLDSVCRSQNVSFNLVCST